MWYAHVIMIDVLHHPRMCALTNDVQQLVHCPLKSSPQKIGCCSYAQNEAQKDHLQRISWLLVTC